MPLRFLSDPHQTPISFLSDSYIQFGAYQIHIRSLPDSYQLPFRFLHSIRCLSDSYQIPIRPLSASIQIPQFQSGANQTPPHQIPIRLLSAPLQIPQCHFGAKTAPLSTWGYGALEVLDPLLSDSYQNPISFFSASNVAPIHIP